MDEFHTVAEVRLAVPNESARHALVRSLSLRLIEDHHLDGRELYCESQREGEEGGEEGGEERGEERGEDERLAQVFEGLMHIVEMLRPLPTATRAPSSSSSSSSSSSTEAALAALYSESMSGALSSAGLRHLLPSLFDVDIDIDGDGDVGRGVGGDGEGGEAASGGAGNTGVTGSKLGTALLFLACVASPSMAEQPCASNESNESYGGVGLWVRSAREGARSAAAASLAVDEA